jgi:galactonate dehydratase
MKITDIKTFAVWVGFRNQLLVKVETDEGLYGWGESGLSGRELAVVGAVNHYREFLIGQEARQIGALWQKMYRSQYFEGRRVLAAAISAIDIALYDLNAKSLGVPVYQLLGGKQRNIIPCFAHTAAHSEAQLIENARILLDAGWNVIRVGVPYLESERDHSLFEPRASISLAAAWLTRLREEIGSEPVLGIDYHHRLSVAETVSFCQRMPVRTLDFLEEPIRDESPEAYISLRSMITIPLAIGEEFASKWAFLPYIERGITNFARIDVCNVGGLTEAVKVAAMAEAHYIDLMPHNPLGPICTAATVHLSAAVPNFSWMEIRMSPTENLKVYDADLFPVQPIPTGTGVLVSDAPGLGIEVNEELAQKQTFKFWEAPHLHRADGSYTNW